jgi:hypothetical protein
MHPATSPSRSARAAALPRLAPLLTVLLLALPGCHESLTEPHVDAPFQSVAKAILSPRTGPQIREVVRDQRAFDEVWRQLWGSSGPPQPDVDFRREMVVVATASLGCFGDVEIEQVERQGSEVIVRMGDAGPPPLCLCFAPEYVFHVVRATRLDGPASFQVRQIKSRCG